jgi:peptidoglycan L-alanyl-D-glutamate endopeptidase CwlK
MTNNVDPRGLLTGVHPDLQRVIRAAAQEPQPFIVIYGLRTLAAEQEALASGHSETLHSRHLAQAHEHDTACAVDVVALTNGEVDFCADSAQRCSDVFGQIADQVQAASDALKVDLQWGGDPVGAWRDGQPSGFRDWGHFQLDPNSYP